jgi:hypothetical protein
LAAEQREASVCSCGELGGKTRSLLFDVGARLRMSLRVVEEEHGNLFVWNLTDVHASVNFVERLIPTNLTRVDREPRALGSVGVLDRETLPTEHDCHSVVWIPMPRRALSGLQALTTDKSAPSLLEDFLMHHNAPGPPYDFGR